MSDDGFNGLSKDSLCIAGKFDFFFLAFIDNGFKKKNFPLIQVVGTSQGLHSSLQTKDGCVSFLYFPHCATVVSTFPTSCPPPVLSSLLCQKETEREEQTLHDPRSPGQSIQTETKSEAASSSTALMCGLHCRPPPGGPRHPSPSSVSPHFFLTYWQDTGSC